MQSEEARVQLKVAYRVSAVTVSPLILARRVAPLEFGKSPNTIEDGFLPIPA